MNARANPDSIPVTHPDSRRTATELLSQVYASFEDIAAALTEEQRRAAQARYRAALDAFDAFVLGKDGER